jgi:hypothetical protein
MLVFASPAGSRKDESVDMFGSRQKLLFRRQADGLYIRLAARDPAQYGMRSGSGLGACTMEKETRDRSLSSGINPALKA